MMDTVYYQEKKEFNPEGIGEPLKYDSQKFDMISQLRKIYWTAGGR